MTLDMFLERSGISLILFAVCLYYAWRVLVMKDLSSIRSKDKPPARDPEGYCRAAAYSVFLGCFLCHVPADGGKPAGGTHGDCGGDGLPGHRLEECGEEVWGVIIRLCLWMTRRT